MANTQRSVDQRAKGGDLYAGALPVRIPPQELRRLSRVQPGTAALHIALEWVAILAAAALCWSFWHPLLYLVTVAFIGARQHALLILMHDGSHYRLFPSHRVNDWVTELFLVWPFFAFTLRDYRRSHFLHHRFVNTDDDPDWVRKKTPDWAFPKRPLALARWLLMSLCGIGILRQIAYVREVSRRSPAPESEPAARDASRGLARFAFIALVLAALTWTGAWLPFLLFWVVPFLTWTQLVLHLRSIAEHFAIARPAGTGIFAQTRNTIAGRLDRLFVASKHVGLHLDHHLYPSVPFHRLPELHALLLRDDRYRSSAHHSAGYWQVLRECLQSDPARAEEGSAR